MGDEYDIFSKYYRQLIHSTKHIEDEISAVNYIISDLNINKQHSILDAACGTGDLLFYLKNAGYNNISGLDASIGMINTAKKILPNIPYFHISWENINNQILSKYDYVFILSISLMHASQEEFPLIFNNIHKILNKNGVFIFDNRFWSIKQGEIIQESRPIGKYRNKVTLNIDSKAIIIDDACYYLKDRQYIKYRIRYEGKEKCIEVSYSRTTTETLIKILYDVGFSNVEARHYRRWPYELLYAYI